MGRDGLGQHDAGCILRSLVPVRDGVCEGRPGLSAQATIDLDHPKIRSHFERGDRRSASIGVLRRYGTDQADVAHTDGAGRDRIGDYGVEGDGDAIAGTGQRPHFDTDHSRSRLVTRGGGAARGRDRARHQRQQWIGQVVGKGHSCSFC